MNWRQIPGYSRYSVSDTGAVRRDVQIYRARPGPVSVSISNAGYPSVGITGDDGVGRKLHVHVLVMLAFVGPRPGKAFVCHADGIKTNNAVHNLRYDTPANNTADAIAHGHDFGWMRRLSEAQVFEIHARCARNEPHGSIARDFAITSAAVCSIATGKSWKGLGLSPLKFVRCPSDSDVQEVARLLESGMSKSAVARQFGTSPPNDQVRAEPPPATTRQWRGLRHHGRTIEKETCRMTCNEYFARLEAAFDPIFNPRPVTDDDRREYQRLDARQRARDDAARRAPTQDALPLP